MNKRIKKKIAKRQIQEKQEELGKQLRKLSPEEIEFIAKTINQAVSNICKAFSQIFDNLFTFLKNLEVEIEKIERRRTQNIRQRTFQISKHSTHNRLKKARIRNQKPRRPKWAYCLRKKTNPFAEMLKRKRCELGLTQSDLAIKLGYHRDTIAKREAGSSISKHAKEDICTFFWD